MSVDDANKVVPIAEPANGVLSLVSIDADFIRSRAKDFPATAELLEQLQPYYEHAARSLGNGGHEQDGTHAASVSDRRLPEALAKEIRTHLGELQSSAFTLEAHGAAQRAEEIRHVAANLHSMLKVAQRFWHKEQMPVAPRTHNTR